MTNLNQYNPQLNVTSELDDDQTQTNLGNVEWVKPCPAHALSVTTELDEDQTQTTFDFTLSVESGDTIEAIKQVFKMTDTANNFWDTLPPDFTPKADIAQISDPEFDSFQFAANHNQQVNNLGPGGLSHEQAGPGARSFWDTLPPDFMPEVNFAQISDEPDMSSQPVQLHIPELIVADFI